jgi:type I restriction enzyme M protein
VATFNVIVANPPYSLKWKPWTSDPRAIGGVAPQSSADWAFVQHMIASMDPKKGVPTPGQCRFMARYP